MLIGSLSWRMFESRSLCKPTDRRGRLDSRRPDHVHDQATARGRRSSRLGVPGPPFRMSLEKYEAMVDAGILTGHDNVHLINGVLVAKMNQDGPHATADLLCNAALTAIIPAGWHVRPDKPVRLPPDSKPEPDQCVVRGSIRDYTGPEGRAGRRRGPDRRGGQHQGLKEDGRDGLRLRGRRHSGLLDHRRQCPPGQVYTLRQAPAGRQGPGGYGKPPHVFKDGQSMRSCSTASKSARSR